MNSLILSVWSLEPLEPLKVYTAHFTYKLHCRSTKVRHVILYPLAPHGWDAASFCPAWIDPLLLVRRQDKLIEGGQLSQGVNEDVSGGHANLEGFDRGREYRA